MSPVVVLNPGAGTARRNLQQVRAAIADTPLLSGAEIVASRGWEHGREVALRAARGGAKLLVAAGGDGTVNSVVNGLMGFEGPRPLLGVLPLGTGNDLARSIGMPSDLYRALEELERRIVRWTDVLRVTRGDDVRYCANVSAGGFSGRVDSDLSDETKESWGPLAYLRTALAKMTELERYDVRFEVDGAGEPLVLPAINVVVANARHAAAGIPVAPAALLDDGAMDVVVLPPLRLGRLAVLVARLAAGRHLDDEAVTTFRAGRLRISSRPPMPFNVDGELIGGTPVSFEALPRSLPVLVGRERPRAL